MFVLRNAQSKKLLFQKSRISSFRLLKISATFVHCLLLFTQLYPNATKSFYVIQVIYYQSTVRLSCTSIDCTFKDSTILLVLGSCLCHHFLCIELIDSYAIQTSCFFEILSLYFVVDHCHIFDCVEASVYQTLSSEIKHCQVIQR